MPENKRVKESIHARIEEFEKMKELNDFLLKVFNDGVNTFKKSKYEFNIYGNKSDIEAFFQVAKNWSIKNTLVLFNVLNHDLDDFFLKYPFLCDDRYQNLAQQILPDFLFLGSFFFPIQNLFNAFF